MRIVITGATGFIGQALVARLLASDAPVAVERLVLSDRSTPDTTNDSRVEWRPGDITDPTFARSLLATDTDAVFHFAGIVSGAAEADFDLGMRVNVDGTRYVLDACRAACHAPSRPPRLVYASSIAVYGQPLPERIDDSTLPMPTLSYGAQKYACEQLINDYSRRGHVDAIALRWPGIVVRPPMRNGALSAFNSDVFRELLGGRPIVSPVSAHACIWILSIERCVDNLLHALTLPTERLGQQRALLAPALPATIDEIIDAVNAARSQDVRGLVT
ncbi:MAG: NAD-dependent epimerase/dehydratase family protein, partial [Burkholderiales bacterium]